MPWLMHHSGFLVSVCRMTEDGRTTYQRSKGKMLKHIQEIGECILHSRPQSVGKDMLEPQWESGVFAGVGKESGELDVVREESVIKVRSSQRRPEEERWNQE